MITLFKLNFTVLTILDLSQPFAIIARFAHESHRTPELIKPILLLLDRDVQVSATLLGLRAEAAETVSGVAALRVAVVLAER